MMVILDRISVIFPISALPEHEHARGGLCRVPVLGVVDEVPDRPYHQRSISATLYPHNVLKIFTDRDIRFYSLFHFLREETKLFV